MDEERKGQKRYWSFGMSIIGVLLLGAVFYGGYAAGTSASARAEVLAIEEALEGSDNAHLDWRLLGVVWDLLDSQYLRHPIDSEKLYYGAIEGIVDAIDDPYSTFFTPELAENFNQDIAGSFFGIGAEIGERDDFVVVIAPLSESPAERAGLQPGDIILAVDGKDASDWTVQEAVLNIRGEEGAPVTLTILRDGAVAAEDVEIIREEISIDSVEWEVLEGGIGLIELQLFNEDTTRLFAEAVVDLKSQGVDELIVDLRNNPGGLLTAAIEIADFWLDGQIVVREKTRNDEFSLTDRPGAVLEGVQTAILVNGGSASASEIVAGALQDYGKAHIIGTTTFGKGSVQEYREFPDGSAVKITVAEWLTPLGRSIDGSGIEPDEIIEYTLEDASKSETPQLQAARSFLENN
jgi:carboxyl-terminal processing protease